jgi:hypothetical protein
VDQPEIEPDGDAGDEPEPGERMQHIWRRIGVVLVVVLMLLGLAALAVLILFVIAMNDWGSNK